MMGWLRRLGLRPEARPPREAREAELLRWNVKVLASEIARQRYEAGHAGQNAKLPERPVRLGLTSRVCRQADIEAAWLHHWCGRLRMTPVYHRKVWEDCFVLQALWEAGVLAPGRRGLGFAVGREWLPAFLAGQGIEVVATDLDPGDARAQAWIGTGQHAAGTPDPLFQPHLVERAEFARLVRWRAVDMAAIPEDLCQGEFDFLWSVCSLEHLGSLERGEAFVVSAMRCLKPGGIAVHTTEYNLAASGDTLESGPTVLYQRRHLDRLAARLAAAGHAMLPLDDAPGAGVLDRFVDLPPYPHEDSLLGALDAPHLRLALEGYPVTSVGIVARAGQTSP